MQGRDLGLKGSSWLHVAGECPRAGGDIARWKPAAESKGCCNSKGSRRRRLGPGR